jgi:hypothetical protein
MNLEELQNDIPELVADARKILCDLECAESCSSESDLCDNIEAAVASVQFLKTELAKMLKAAKRLQQQQAAA